ncbi:MAG: tyrosine--tRNA ligase [Nitrososphaerales archaeon]
MDVDEKISLISRPPTEEITTPDQMRELLGVESHPTHYIGFELSGPLHLGSLIIAGNKINDFLKAGIRCKVFLADWHSYINHKFKGNWDLIKQSSDYYEEAFKFFCPGVEVVKGAELYENNNEYWLNFVRFCKEITLARNVRCLTIMGRSEKDSLDFGQYLYPPMQAIDIKTMDLDIVHAGLDQRKVHMLVREVFPKLKWKVPLAVHHHLLLGLEEPKRGGIDEDQDADLMVSSKMSKSNPSLCIFVHDSADDIRKKLAKAWCPEAKSEANPILDITKHIIFHDRRDIVVERPSKYGGNVSYDIYDGLESDYLQKKIHPADLKMSVARELDTIIEPVRKHFDGRIKLEDLLKD